MLCSTMVSDVARTLITALTTGIKIFQFKKFGRYSNKYLPKFPDSKKCFTADCSG